MGSGHPNVSAQSGLAVEAKADDGGPFLGLNRGQLLGGLLVLGGYYLGARIGLAFTFHPHPVSVMWPPNSILLAALLLTPVQTWWWFLLAAFPAHLGAELPDGVPLGMTLCWYISNCSEALLGAVSVRFLIGPSARFDNLRNLGILFACVGFVAPFLSSFLDATFVALNRFGNQNYWKVWQMRFCSNVFTALTLVPLIVTWGQRLPRQLFRVKARRLVEPVLLAMGLLTVNWLVFCWLQTGPASVPTLLYAPLPFLLWAAVRFGTQGTSAAILAVALFAIWGAVHGRGPFASHSPEDNALSIQAFFAVVSITLMSLAAAIGERRKAEERFTKAFHSGPDAMVISRLRDGLIIDTNARCEKVFGYSRLETIGRKVLDFNIYASASDRDRIISGASEGGLHDLEVSLRTKSGEFRQTLVSADTDEIEGERCLIIIIRDITDRKRAEEAQQNLAHASRLAVVGELTAMIAHEVNQPLGAILSNADAAEILLQSDRPPLDEIREILADIRKNDLRADEAIRRIRALLRKREMQIQPLNLNEMVSDVLRLVTGDALRRRVQVQSHLAPGLPDALGDRIHLQQVLLNLILNAMDAMNDTPAPLRPLRVHTRQNENCLEVAVTDCGPGIVPAQMNQIFESFFTTKKDGMGLGLSIARSIIEAHRGRIWAENRQGGGAIFRFTVPCVASP
jgi:PAS domain S-box-containing protein